MTLKYLTIDQLIERIEQPNRSKCRRILEDHRLLFETAQGSTHNHQAWPGGYIDHITDVMNYLVYEYALQNALGRPMRFSLSDALLIIFLHDIEKPWRIKLDAEGAYNAEGLETKEQFKAFREAKLKEYGIVLTPYQMNALTYVEGEYRDYSSKRRVMNELAAFCGNRDRWSARERYDYPKPSGEDEWIGAGRFRST
jgi:hypothetical protein